MRSKLNTNPCLNPCNLNTHGEMLLLVRVNPKTQCWSLNFSLNVELMIHIMSPTYRCAIGIFNNKMILSSYTSTFIIIRFNPTLCSNPCPLIIYLLVDILCLSPSPLKMVLSSLQKANACRII